MKRWIGAGTVLCLLVASGCRTNPYCSSCGGGVTIPPPPTYSVNVPRTGQAYYNGQVASNNTGLLNTNAPAAVPAQNGWRSAANTNFTLGSGTTGQPTGNSVLDQRGGATQPNPASQPANTQQNPFDRPTLVRPAPTNGASYREPTNYQTTSVDERFDNSRLVVTDASLVRAPAPAGQPMNAGRLPRTPMVIQSQPVLVGQNGVPFQSFSQTPTLVSGGYQTVPAVSNVSYGAAAPQVLGQSTATYDAQSSGNYRNGWRDSQVY